MANNLVADIIAKATGQTSKVISASKLLNNAQLVEVEVPARTSILHTLDGIPVTTDTNPQFLFLESNINGVNWWAIDRTNQAVVSPTTREFGYILDLTTHEYEHNHGQTSNLATDHAVLGTPIYYDYLPCFQSYTQDKANRTADHIVTKDLINGPSATKCHAGGHALKYQFANSVGDSPRPRTMYMWGKDGYQDFGLQNDGLEFLVSAYIEDTTKIAQAKFKLHSYPYSLGNQELGNFAGLNSYGYTYWATNDPSLCRRSANPSTGWGVGGNLLVQDLLVSPGATFPTTPALANGFVSYRVQKENLFGADGFTYSRVTMLEFSFEATATTATTENRLLNISFGPRPGKGGTIRPHAISTARLWGSGLLLSPSIGLQNPNETSARVKIAYGTK